MTSITADRNTAADSLAIGLHDVSITFPGQPNPVPVGLDLQVRCAEFHAVIGPNGCGKTTLLRIIHSLLHLSSEPIATSTEHITEPGRRRGFIFQSDCLLPWRWVIDNVGFRLEPAGMTRRRGAREIPALTGLHDAAGKFPAWPSGGMRQRVNLARALAPSRPSRTRCSGTSRSRRSARKPGRSCRSNRSPSGRAAARQPSSSLTNSMRPPTSPTA